MLVSLPVVRVVCATTTISDAIAKNDQGGIRFRCPGFDSAHEVPMRGAGSRHRRCIQMVPLLHPRRRPTSWVTSDAVAGLACLRIQIQGDHGLRRGLEVHRVCVYNLSFGNSGRARTTEGEPHQSCSVDAIDSRFSARRESDRGGCYWEIAAAKGV